MRSRAIVLRKPHGTPAAVGALEIVDLELQEIGPGEVLVANSWLSVDPYMHMRLSRQPGGYGQAYPSDLPLEGDAVGVVVQSRAEALEVGDTVAHFQGWREHAVGPASRFHRVDPMMAPPSTYLGVLGMPGLAAYIGLWEIARIAPGDVVYVSAAAGAVGSVAGQLARIAGASMVIGSAGGPAKVENLRELGYGAVFDHRAGDVEQLLGEAAPDGIDVYFDNVGGRHLEAAIEHMRPSGRVALCGAISHHETSTSGVANLRLAVGKRLSLRGFLVGDHIAHLDSYRARAAGWLRSGQLRYQESIVVGLEQMPGALQGLLDGANVGKMLVRLPETCPR